MSADLAAFVDSNVLVYAVSNDEPEKQSRATPRSFSSMSVRSQSGLSSR